MSRLRHLVFFVALAFAGCRQQPAPDPKVADKPEEKIGNVAVAPPKIEPKPAPKVAELEPIAIFAAPNDPAYDAALTQGLTLLADQDYAKALQAFETAKAAKDTDFVRGEIAKLKTRLETDAAGKKTTQDIQALLDDGKPQVANQLINDALKVFGGGPEAVKLVQLQIQADALANAGGAEDAAVRAKRLRDQAQVAMQDLNLRAAAALLQQSLVAADDAGVRDQLNEIQGKLEKYDGLRTRAAELRRNPANVDDALALYRQAAATWNTPEVRQDIDDCAFALQQRRDTISVADFEVQGDVGVPAAGDVIAEELLPTFKGRFDLVEREQVGKVVRELNLGAAFQDNPDQQREVGKLARVRFLVLGSVNRNGAVTARARLVDTSTGLIVQTAKVSAPTFDQLVGVLPELTKQLLMTDEQKLAFDQVQLQNAQKMDPVAVNAPLPPPPPAAGGNIVPGPWIDNAPPPAFGALQIAQFQALPPLPAAPLPMVVIEPPPVDFRAQLVNAAVQMGDGFFLRGQFREAFQQYEFALSLAPNDFAIRARLDQCRPMLPPVVVVQQFGLRPRLAILNFQVIGNLPPGLSIGVPDLLAPYFRCNYDVVDSGQVYWMMGRLGLTQFDLMNNANARRWLGRSLGIQFFLLGNVQHGSIDVNTYLLNAEQGWLQGSGHIRVHSPFELKLRAGELAQLTQMPPGQRAAFVAAQPQVNLAFTNGQTNLNKGNFALAITFFQDVLRQRPGDVQATLFLNQARQSNQRRELEELRRKDIAQREALAAAELRRQQDVARAAEEARALATQQAAALAAAERQAIAQKRAAAYADIIARARDARQARNFAVAANLYQGALDMSPIAGASLPVSRDTLVGELAQARSEIARANAEKARAEQAAEHEKALRQKRDVELAAARQRLEDERLKAAALAAEQHKANDAKYQAAFDQGQTLMTQGKFDAAIVALQGARQIKKTDAVEAMLHTAQSRQAEAHAKGDAERKQIEEKIAAQRRRQKDAEEESKRNHDQYDQSIKSAKDAFASKNYDAALAHYETANKLFKTDDAMSGIKKVQEAKKAATAAEKEKTDKAEQVKKYLSSGTASLDAGNYADSLQQLEQARKLDPSNVDVLAALSRAEQARNRAALDLRQKTPLVTTPLPVDPTKLADDAKKKADALKALAARQELTYELSLGQKALQSNDHAGAVKAFQAALRIDPSNSQATQGLRQAQTAAQTAVSNAEREKAAKLAADQAAREKAAKLAADDEARKTAAAKAAADQAAREKAAKLAADDEARKSAAARAAAADQAAREKAAKDDEARKAAAKAAADNAAKDKAMHAQQEEQKKKQSYAVAVQRGQQLANEKKYPEALQAFQGANSIYPNDPQVSQLIAQTNQAWDAAKRNNAAEDAAKKKAADDRAQYQNHLNQGQQALNQKQFPQAVQHFEAALRFMPGDQTATRLLAQARAGKK